MPEPLNVFIRGTLAFFTLFLLARALGKKQISQLTFFDYVTGITIGSIAASLTVDLTLQTPAVWVGLLTWAAWTAIFGILSMYSKPMRTVIDGEATVVVQNGKILESDLKQLNYNVEDLRMQLRQKNVFNVADVEFAVLEPNGKLSVLKKSQLQPVTPSDLNLPTSYKGLAVELMIDGKMIDPNLKQLNLSREWLEAQIKQMGHAMRDVYYAEIDTEGKLYVDVRDDLDKVPQIANISDRSV